MKWPNFPSYVVTAIVVIVSTLATTYVTQQVNTQLDAQQTKMIENMDMRLRAVEMSRFTQADADRSIQHLTREVDRISRRIDRLEELSK